MIRPFKNVSDKINSKVAILESFPEQERTEVQKSVDNSRLILESVKADGSWGVHNLKYTEALPREADTIITLEK